MVIMIQDYVSTSVFLKTRSLTGWTQLITCVFNYAHWDTLLTTHQNPANNLALLELMLITLQEDVSSAVL